MNSGANLHSKQNLKKNTLVYGIGNLSVFAIKFFLVPLYTFYLSKEALGWFDIVVSTAPIICVVFSAHIELALLRWMLEEPIQKVKEKVFTNSIFYSVFGILFFSIAYLLTVKFNLFDTKGLTTPLVLYLYLISVWVYIFLKQAIRSIYSAKSFVLTDIIFTFLFLSLVIYNVIILNTAIHGILISYIIATSLILFYWFFIAKFYQYFSFKSYNLKNLKELLAYSIPLVPNTINLWSINTIVKYVILLYLGVASNGLFAIAFKIAFIIQMINGIFNKAWQDKAISSYKQIGFNTEIISLFQKYFVFFACMTIGLIASQSFVVKYIIDSSFQEASNYIFLLAIGFFFMGLANFISVIYQCEKETISITLSSVLANIVLVVTSFLLIKPLQLYGASIAFMLGNFVLFLYRFIHVRKFIKLKVDLKLVALLFIALLLILLLSFKVNYGSYYATILAIIFTLSFNYNTLIKILPKLNK